MTNEKLIEQFRSDPTVTARSSYFRVMDGMMFIKSSDPWGRLKGWRPVFILSDVVLYLPPPWALLPERGCGAVSYALNGVAGHLKEDNTVINIEEGTEVPENLYQKPKLRHVPSRQCYIRDIMETIMRHEPTYYSRREDIKEEDRESFVNESYKIAWEYAITSVASGYTKAKKKLEMEVNRVVGSTYASDVSSGVSELHKQVMRDDLSSAEESYLELGLCVKKLQGVMSTAYRGIQEARQAACIINFRHITWFDEVISPEQFRSGNGGRHILSIHNPNIIEGWGDFSKFLTNIGIDIPRPFGEDLSLESVSRLAAFHDVSNESYYNFKRYFLKLKEDQAETTETCNLYLG